MEHHRPVFRKIRDVHSRNVASNRQRWANVSRLEGQNLRCLLT